MRYIVVITAFLLPVSIGCKSSPVSQPAKPAILSGTDAEIREELLAKIPVGTTQTEAERIVKEHGLRCSAEIDDNTNEPYLSCGYSDNSDMWATWVWQIRIDCPGGVVSEIQCKQAGIGP
jgi:hypothetical protein